MKTLGGIIDSFIFIEREKKNGKYIFNKCGRDFLYFAFNYYYPNKFNGEVIKFEEQLGTPVYPWLAWTQIQFIKISKFLKQNKLYLNINKQEVKSFFNFVKIILFSRFDYFESLKEIEKSIDCNNVCGIDISLGFGGLLDHVMFVYGYDEDNLYVFDTHKVEKLEYEETEHDFLYRLSKETIKKRWTKFGRIWEVGLL